MPTPKQNTDIENAKWATRNELFKQIEEAAADTKNLTPQARAATLKDLAEAFAWTSATAQPH
ncbi:hypothetical protein ABZ890_39615 [Streptomyces sp. NPDC046984]|uniref:hypothetical protein n=1 Tax=Streptomyces sp. NPDC046984 TaxID=3155138 RepID=UPI0033D60628